MNDPDIKLWFSQWDRIEAVAISAALLFLVVVVLMRLLGKRTTSRMNNFDWIVTVAMGSLVASGVLSKTVSLSDTLAAMLVLGLCQWTITALILRSPRFARLVKPTPRLVVQDGTLIRAALRKERVTTDELFSRLRQQGFTTLSEVKWAILETDGQFTIIRDTGDGMDLARSDLMGNLIGADRLEKRASDQS